MWAKQSRLKVSRALRLRFHRGARSASADSGVSFALLRKFTRISAEYAEVSIHSSSARHAPVNNVLVSHNQAEVILKAR